MVVDHTIPILELAMQDKVEATLLASGQRMGAYCASYICVHEKCAKLLLDRPPSPIHAPAQ